MASLKTLIFLQAYNSTCGTSTPQNNFRWTREITNASISNALSETFQVSPGATQTLFSGTRTLTQDGTTAYSLTLAPFQTSIYQLTNTGGLAPTFRTLRAIGTDSTTQVTTSLNGPILTYTFAPAAAASFAGAVPFVTSVFTITATNIGTVGNSVLIVGDGTSSLTNLVLEWNTANPSNQVTFSGDGTQIPSSGADVQLTHGVNITSASYSGTPEGCDFSVSLTAATAGTGGNAILLVGDGTSSISTLISNWNTANPSNQVNLTSGDGSQIPDPAAPIQLSGGLNPAYAYFTGSVSTNGGSITIVATNVDSTGNSIVLTGDGVSSVNTLISNWNTANPSNTITLTSGSGTQIAASGSHISLSGGITAPNLSSVQPGDNVLIGNLFNPLNQGTTGIWTIVSKTSNSFSVVNPNGYNQGPITLGSGYATQLRVFSGTGVQVGDTLVISSGFSPVSLNSYIITLVTDSYVQFSYTGSLPAEGPITTEVAVYSMNKTMVYMEVDQNTQLTINGGTPGPTIQPTVSNGVVNPGLFLLNSTVYSLAVTNTSITTSNVTLLSTE